jgi:rhodanese-related sulfurtransferase
MHVFSKYCRLSFMFFLMGCAVAQVQADSGEMESISPKEASTMYAGKEAIIVDVREDSEWNEQHITGVIHIPLAQLKERLSELKQYKDSPVITQCRSGRRSAQAFDVLKPAGFSKVYNMDGGIMAWDKAGLKTQ